MLPKRMFRPTCGSLLTPRPHPANRMRQRRARKRLMLGAVRLPPVVLFRRQLNRPCKDIPPPAQAPHPGTPTAITARCYGLLRGHKLGGMRQVIAGISL